MGLGVVINEKERKEITVELGKLYDRAEKIKEEVCFLMNDVGLLLDKYKLANSSDPEKEQDENVDTPTTGT